VLLWAVGVLTAALTATYMFRLVFMTFHGERSVPVNHVDPADVSDHKSHGTHVHDAPPAMAIALIVLAVGSVVAGWAGIGGRFEHFLEPSFGTAVAETAEGGPEVALMVVSVLVAVTGIALAAYFFLVNRRAAASVAEQWPGVHRLLANKYYVDEIYDVAVVQPVQILSEDGLWKGVDAGVIDRTVNGVARVVAGGADVLRRLQTGSVRAYAASIFLGVVLILGYYLWP